MTKLNSNITRFLGGVTQGKLGKKNITVQVGRIDNAVLGTDQIVASGDAKEIFTQAGDLKKGMDDIIGTDAIRSVFDYICPINLYSKNELAKKAVNTSIKVGNPKKDKAWEQFVEFSN